MLSESSPIVTSSLVDSQDPTLVLLHLLIHLLWDLRIWFLYLSPLGLLHLYILTYHPQSRFEKSIKPKRYLFEVARQILRQNWEMTDEFKDQCDAIINRCQVKIAFIDEEICHRMPFFTGNYRPKYVEMTYRTDKILQHVLSIMQEDPKTFQSNLLSLSQMVESLLLEKRDWYYSNRVQSFMAGIYYTLFRIKTRSLRT